MSMHNGILGQTTGGGSVSHEQLDEIYRSGQMTEQQWNQHLQQDKTLGDYIARKYRDDAFNQVNAEKKLTFEQWWETAKWLQDLRRVQVWDAATIWKAAQENK